jgi:hypothetical protein
VEDPEIIKWCKDNGYVWITHDTKAKKKHHADLLASRISVLWVRGQGEQFSSWQQFKVVMRVIDRLHEALLAAHGAIHFEAGLGNKSTLKVTWAESHSDMPHNRLR